MSTKVNTFKTKMCLYNNTQSHYDWDVKWDSIKKKCSKNSFSFVCLFCISFLAYVSNKKDYGVSK